MGMYDNIKFETKCPKCGNKVNEFQSKDGPCMMALLDFWDVNCFYGSCSKCRTWITYKIWNKPNRKLDIEDYDKEIVYPGKVSEDKYKEEQEELKKLKDVLGDKKQ